MIEDHGDGKQYKLSLRTDQAFDGVNEQAAFEAPASVRNIARPPLALFIPTFRGRSAPGASRLTPAQVRQIGLMIADKQIGAFWLAVRSIRVE